MPRGKLLTEAQRKKICELYKQGYTYKQIADKTDCCVYTVNRVIHQENIIQQYARRSTPARKVTEQIIENRKSAISVKATNLPARLEERVYKLNAYNYPKNLIAEFLKVPITTVEEILDVGQEKSCASTKETSVKEYLLDGVLNLLCRNELDAAIKIIEAIKTLTNGDEAW